MRARASEKESRQINIYYFAVALSPLLFSPRRTITVLEYKITGVIKLREAKMTPPLCVFFLRNIFIIIVQSIAISLRHTE